MLEADPSIRSWRTPPGTFEVRPALEVWTDLTRGGWVLAGHFSLAGERRLLLRQRRPKNPSLELNWRERQVIRAMACCYSVKHCGLALSLAPATVCGYLKSAVAKLGLANRTELWMLFEYAPSRRRGHTPLPPSGLQLRAARSGEAELGYPYSRWSPGSLTHAEHDVCGLVLAGGTNRSIARARSSAPHTVANQLSQIFRKLEVGSRDELCALLVHHGMFGPGLSPPGTSCLRFQPARLASSSSAANH